MESEAAAAATTTAAAAPGGFDLNQIFAQIQAGLTPPAAAASTARGGDQDAQTREALQFVLSPQGSIFREFLLDEAVKGIDALSRDNAARVLQQVGLGDATVPLLLPGALLPGAAAGWTRRRDGA